MVNREFAAKFAQEWVEAWNRHDLEAVLSHYSDDFEMSSPYIAAISGEHRCTLKGKAAVAAYWSAALERMPGLHFELRQTLFGADSVTLCYQGVRGMAAEVFFFDADGRVVKAAAHYE